MNAVFMLEVAQAIEGLPCLDPTDPRPQEEPAFFTLAAVVYRCGAPGCIAGWAERHRRRGGAVRHHGEAGVPAVRAAVRARGRRGHADRGGVQSAASVRRASCVGGWSRARQGPRTAAGRRSGVRARREDTLEPIGGTPPGKGGKRNCGASRVKTCWPAAPARGWCGEGEGASSASARAGKPELDGDYARGGWLLIRIGSGPARWPGYGPRGKNARGRWGAGVSPSGCPTHIERSRACTAWRNGKEAQAMEPGRTAHRRKAREVVGGSPGGIDGKPDEVEASSFGDSRRGERLRIEVGSAGWTTIRKGGGYAASKKAVRASRKGPVHRGWVRPWSGRGRTARRPRTLCDPRLTERDCAGC